jgi:ribosome-associated translation inhibitor RaiA
MKEHIQILKSFKEHPLAILMNEKDHEKLTAAINKSIKLLEKQNSRNKFRNKLSNKYYSISCMRRW